MLGRTLVKLVLVLSLLAYARHVLLGQCESNEYRDLKACAVFRHVDTVAHAKAEQAFGQMSAVAHHAHAKVAGHPHFKTHVQPYVDALALKWHDGGYHERAVKHAEQGSQWVQRQFNAAKKWHGEVLHPHALNALDHVKIAGQHTLSATHRYGQCALYRVRTQVWPQIQRFSRLAWLHVRIVSKLAFEKVQHGGARAWACVQGTQTWKEVVQPQTERIVDALQLKRPVFESVTSEVSSIETEVVALVASSASSVAESVKPSVYEVSHEEDVEEDAEKDNEDDGDDLEDEVDELEDRVEELEEELEELQEEMHERIEETETIYETHFETITRSISASVHAPSPASSSAEKPAKSSWYQRIERTVDGALRNLETDAQEFFHRTVNSAKPSIMGLLREIHSYGEKAVQDLTTVASRVEAGEKIDRNNLVYEPFAEASRTMAEKAFEVRDRAEKLANEALAGIGSVRQVTLDSLDDYFDVVLLEAAREISTGGEWNEWKQYHQMKEQLSELRKKVELYEFDMNEINVALRESQSASILLVQEFNQQLTYLRQKCQLIFQEEDGVNANQPVDESEEYENEDEDEDEDEENGNGNEDDDEDETAESHISDIYLEEQEIVYPFNDDIEIPDGVFVETYTLPFPI